MSIAPKYLRVEMPDGSLWDVPVDVIARNRAVDMACKFDRDVERSLTEDTLPLFEDDYEVIDWAANSMNWADVKGFAVRVEPPQPSPVDYQEGWVNGKKEVVTKGGGA